MLRSPESEVYPLVSLQSNNMEKLDFPTGLPGIPAIIAIFDAVQMRKP